MSRPVPTPTPTEIHLHRAEKRLDVAFDDGSRFSLPAEYLRVESPSAETKGHGNERLPPPVRKRRVGVTGAEPVGRYALRIRFDDGHDTGLYTWPYLAELAAQKTDRMSAYLKRLSELGLSRD